MTRLIVRTGLLAVATVFFSLAANAQIGRQYTAEIPFDFVVKGKSLNAGNYAIGPVTATTSVGSITLFDKKSGEKFVIGQATLGVEEIKLGTLNFVKNGSSYVLSHINTPSFRMKFKPDAAALAQNKQTIPEVVSINLVP